VCNNLNPGGDSDALHQDHYRCTTTPRLGTIESVGGGIIVSQESSICESSLLLVVVMVVVVSPLEAAAGSSHVSSLKHKIW
jgi:hypothetical protein